MQHCQLGSAAGHALPSAASVTTLAVLGSVNAAPRSPSDSSPPSHGSLPARPAVDAASSLWSDVQTAGRLDTSASMQTRPYSPPIRQPFLLPFVPGRRCLAVGGCCSTRRRRCQLTCVALCCSLLLAVAVSVGVLYPQPPSIVAHSLRLLQLTVDLSPSAAASPTSSASSAVNVSALLSVSFTLHNPNPYSAHHSASLVSIASLPPSAPLLGQLLLPAGFISARGSEDVSSRVYVSSAISSPTQLQRWQSGGVTVAATASTAGYVDFLLGLHVHFTVHSRCSATLTLGLQLSSLQLSQQHCNNGL